MLKSIYYVWISSEEISILKIREQNLRGILTHKRLWSKTLYEKSKLTFTRNPFLFIYTSGIFNNEYK